MARPIPRTSILRSGLKGSWSKRNMRSRAQVVCLVRSAFSHSLVHEIGGLADSHVNTTRRILLLLESKAIGDRTVCDRVIRALLSRYLEEDTHFHPASGSRSFVPRFLLTDVVRYWRTIAVDYLE
jgi:hypothetical protein